MDDKLAQEFKKFAKQQEKKDLRNEIASFTEKDFHKLRNWALMLFDTCNHQQIMLEMSMMQNLIGTYPDSDITFPLLDEE